MSESAEHLFHLAVYLGLTVSLVRLEMQILREPPSGSHIGNLFRRAGLALLPAAALWTGFTGQPCLSSSILGVGLAILAWHIRPLPAAQPKRTKNKSKVLQEA